MKGRASIVLALAALLLASHARAAGPSPSTSSSSSGASPTCLASIPEGVTPPTLLEHVVTRAKAGALVQLEILVRHEAGESATLLLDLNELSKGDVRLADPANFGKGALPVTKPDPADATKAVTLLEIPFVVLSTSLPRKTFTIPSVRVIVVRKGGSDITVCTKEQKVDVDQPIANTPDPSPRPNPATMPQKTRNEELQRVVLWSIAALAAGILLAAACFWWRSRPKAPAPAPAPPSPWSVALADLAILGREWAAEKVETKPYYDRLSDIVRRYLGEMYGFDGLDMTTDETLARMKRLLVPLPIEELTQFLGACDLVKFADQTPEREEGSKTADLALYIVRTTSGRTSMRPRPFEDGWSSAKSERRP